ncbi:hypothetical protein BDQ17DRAFT_1316598 [Cyathus striatus]|nr:hypothetical protein BDQ17DRAFT_1316598 [Cyathus striatus]
MFSLPGYQLTGVFLETLFYGVNATSFAFCLRSLLTNDGKLRRREGINWIMLIIGSTLFSIASLDVFLNFTWCLQAFIFDNRPGGATAVFTDLGNWITLTTSATVLLQTVIGDGVLIYRCWIVYSRSWRIITVSILLWIGATISMAFVIHIQATLHASGTVTAKELEPPNRSFWILSIIQNLLTTSLIVGRIWFVDHQNSKYLSAGYQRTSELKKVMRRIIESGLLYTLAVIITFITYACRSNALYVASKVEKQIVGIAFNLIIIRASKSRPNEYTMTSATVEFEVQMNHTSSTTTGTGTTNTRTPAVQLAISKDYYSFSSKEDGDSKKGEPQHATSISDTRV